MNNTAVKDGQAPARWFGGCVAVIVTLFACSCLLGIWYFTAKDSLGNLSDSIQLVSNGVTTTGTVTSVEAFSNGDPSFPSSDYRLTVNFEVDGKSYSVVSSGLYNPLDKSWVGEPMPIIYDPEDPNRALIDNFRERWLNPVTDSLP